MTTMNTSQWGKEAKARRKALRASLNAVAREAGVTDQTVRNAEMGLKQPNPETIEAIDKALALLEADSAARKAARTRRSVDPSPMEERVATLERELLALTTLVHRMNEGLAKSPAEHESARSIG